MAYRVYSTPAFVCGVYNRNIADRTVLLYTREAGLLHAQVKSVREERSKHRYALTEFSLLNVSLIKGKSGWRIIGVEPQGSVYTRLVSRESRTFVRDSVRFLIRMVRGEMAHAELFDTFVKGIVSADLYSERAKLEYMHTLLRLLGYTHFFEYARTPDDVLQSSIQKALDSSHL